jgi:acetolactate synthase regulatory subunit
MDVRAERRQVLHGARVVRRLGFEAVQLRRAARERQVAERAHVHADVDDDRA